MKKEKFGLLNFDSVETLSREELKKVTGGYGTTPPPHGTVCSYTCTYITKPDEIKYAPAGTDPCPWYATTTVGACAGY